MAGDKNKKGNDKKGQAGSRQASVQRQSQARQERDQSLKRRRFSSEGTDGSDCDPEIILDALIGNLGTDDNLLERFVTHLLRVPNIQQKIVSHVSDMLSNNTTGDQLPNKYLNISVRPATIFCIAVSTRICTGTYLGGK